MTDPLHALYKRIPKVLGCRTGCSDCCGPVPMNAQEARVKADPPPREFMGHTFTPLKPDCGTCAYATPEGCAIYEDRPFMCRLFATTVEEPLLTCPHGAKPVHPLSAKQVAALTAAYMRKDRR